MLQIRQLHHCMIKMSGSVQKCHIYVHRSGSTPQAHARVKEFPQHGNSLGILFWQCEEVLVSADNQVRKAHRELDECVCVCVF